MSDGIPLVRIRNLTVSYRSRGGFLGGHARHVRALNSVDLDVYSQETLGVVGESGCGKTTFGRALMGLVKLESGEIELKSEDNQSLCQVTGRTGLRDMQMVFQNPYSSLNPRMKVINLVAEPLRAHTDLRGASLTDRIRVLLHIVGLQDEHLDRFPHALSGGQAQRVAIARALALDPRFLVLDEPTSALDVSVQAHIVNLLSELQSQRDLTYLFISHDLAVVNHISQRISVMYLGEIVEQGLAKEVFDNPRHPYTQALLSATPEPDPDSKRDRIILKGAVPSTAALHACCHFHTRCPVVIDHCREIQPPKVDLSDTHWATCHLLTE